MFMAGMLNGNEHGSGGGVRAGVRRPSLDVGGFARRR